MDVERPSEQIPVDVAALRALPKVELHVHLEGSFTRSRIARLAEQAGVALPRPVETLFEFADLDDFLSLLDLWCGLVRSPEDVEQIAHAFASRLLDDGVVYAEVMVNPIHWTALAPEALLEAVDAGFQRAHRDGLADCRLLVSLARKQSGEEADRLVELIGARDLPRLVGLSLDGNEAREGRTSPRFVPAYRRAAALGLGLTAHAGESSGCEGVRDALDLLGVTRIDHGVRAVEAPELLQRLADDRITCNVCISSNLATMYGSLAAHPLRRLVEAGVPVTINTDDPEPLDRSLNDELALAADHLGWSLDDVVDTMRAAIDAAFCGPHRATELRALVDCSIGRRDGDDPTPTFHPGRDRR